MFDAILFDLDGTLADTASDLGGAINYLLREEGLPEMPLAALRPYASQGARGLIGAAFGIDTGHADFTRLSERFLALYAEHLCDTTALFAGTDELLFAIESRQLPWGIVTNKQSCFTTPLVESLGLHKRAATVVSGDTTSAAKPSPLPILHACKEIGVTPGRTLYVGDDPRDIQAGLAAGTKTAAAAFGYLGSAPPIASWGADIIIDSPPALLDYIFPQAENLFFSPKSLQS